MAKTIVIIGTLDTKGEELKYIKELIQKKGHKTIVIDGGIQGAPLFRPDVTRDEVAKAAATNMKEVIALGNEGKAMLMMADGASKIAQRLYREGKLDGIIGIGGTMGTSLGVTVMKGLPLLLPKVMVSTLVFTPFFRAELISKDVILVPAVVDFWGLDETTRTILENAAGAISGMVETHKPREGAKKPLIAITTHGGFKYVWYAKPLLEQKGYDVTVFHGIGPNFEEFVEQGLVAGALDFIACNHLVSDLCGGINISGPIRFEAARRRRIPQVFAPAGLDYCDFAGTQESIPSKYRDREVVMHNIFAPCGINTNEKEKGAVGQMLAQKLNEMTGPTAMLLPRKGFSKYDKPGGMFHDPEGRKAFIEAFKSHVEPRVKVIELDMHINDPEFAERAVAILDDMMKTSHV